MSDRDRDRDRADDDEARAAPADPASGRRRDLPAPPDPARLDDLRRRVRRDRVERGGAPGGLPLPGMRTADEAGRRARDLGAYTIIPMMMVAGPAIGYLLGVGAERVLGGKPWPSLAGMLWGMLAAFRQIYLILRQRGAPPAARPDPVEPEPPQGSSDAPVDRP